MGARIAERLAGFAAGLSLDDVPGAVVERAKLHVLDAVGIGLAAARYDFGHKTLTALRGLAGEGEHPVIGMPARLPLRDAALMNGFLIHGLDYDDTHVGGVIHATASAVPTVLAAGRRHGASGREALAAYLAAVEASARLAAAAKGGFHRLGFHPTGIVGAFGAALAAGRLAGLTEAQLAHAQGIALSMASGSLQFLDDGAWTKRMHPGWAWTSSRRRLPNIRPKATSPLPIRAMTINTSKRGLGGRCGSATEKCHRRTIAPARYIRRTFCRG